MILVYLAPHVRWQRWGDGRLIASAAGWPVADPTVPLVLAVPGEDVALHWIDLPDLAPAQAAAAARLALADRLAESDPHIAVASGTGPRAVAVVSRVAMAGWLAELARGGLSASRIIPDPLLLPVPAAGWAVARDGAKDGGRVLARSADAAFAAEAELAAALIGTDAVADVALAPPAPDALNLLVGDFGTITHWQAPAGLWRRWAVLAACLAGLWLAGDVAALLRARAAASAADAQTLALARPLLPAGAEDGAAALAGLAAVAQQRGADGGLAALAAPVVQALSQRPGAGLGSLSYTPAGGLVAGVAGGPAEAQALAAALAPSGLTVSLGATRATADASITDLTVRK